MRSTSAPHNRLNRSVIFWLILTLGILPLYAQDTGLDSPISVGETQAELLEQNRRDLAKALSASDFEMVALLLMTSLPEHYPVMEQMVLDAAREALFSNEFDRASKLAELVLLANLDSQTAQDIYTGIEEARRQQIALEARKRQLEAEEAERLRQEELRLQREAFVSLFRDNSTISLSAFPLAGAFLYSDYAKAWAEYGRNSYLPDLGYGVGFAAALDFKLSYLLTALETTLEWYPPLVRSAWGLNWNADLLLGAPSLTGPLVLHVGYQYLGLFNPVSAPVVMYHALGSPLIGLGVRSMQLSEKVDLNAWIDWKAVAFSDPLIDLALNGMLGFRWLLLEMDNRRSLYLDTSARADFLMVDSRVEWRLNLLVGVVLTLNDRRTYVYKF